MATWTEADAEALKIAIKSGVLTVRYDGPPARSITYQNLESMRSLLAAMLADVTQTTGGANYSLIATRKGL